MIVKTITYKELDKAIRISFDNDPHVLDLYDPNVNVESVDDIAKDIIKKIEAYPGVKMKGVYDKGKLVGYYVRGAGMLISFALCVEYRVRKFKRELFDLIKRDFKGMFVCFLWSKNVRAIRFLSEKCGMQIIESDNILTKLICQ